jgi:PAS domain S-box-containing protein
MGATWEAGGSAGPTSGVVERSTNETFLRDAHRVAKMASFFVSASSKQIEWDEGLVDLLGGDLPVPLGLDAFLSRVHAGDRPRVSEFVWRAHGDDVARTSEFRIVPERDGYVRQVRLSTEPRRGEGGAPTGFFATMVDVTEYAQAKDALRESEARWRSVAINPFDFVTLVDRSGVFLWVNHTAPGIHREDLIGRASLFDFVAKEHHDVVRAALARTFEQGLPSHYEAYSPSQHAWYSSAVGPIVRDGRTTVASVLSRNITEAKRAEAELLRRERMLADAQRIAGVGSFYWEKSTGRLEWSAEMYRICGVDPGTPPTIALHDARVHPEDRARVIAARERALETGVVEPYEYRLIRASDGATRHVLAMGEALQAVGEDERGFLGTTLDVTARRELEADLVQSRKLEAVGRLAGGIAHDFNNVLTAIIGNVELVARETREDSTASVCLRAIRAASERASNLTRQLLSFARRQIVFPRVVEPNPLIEAVAELLRPLLGEEIRLDLSLASDAWPIRIDVGQFEQLLINLAVNARDAMPSGGRLTVQTENVAVDLARGPFELSCGDYVRVQVTDTGHGIPKELQTHVFEPFFTTKPAGRGTGLGLATCHGIVKQSGGHIELESAEGRGTRVIVFLPRASGSREVEREPRSFGTIPRGDETVLVVEDDPMVRSLAVLRLSDLGYRVLDAGTGDEALFLLRSHAGRIDVLFTDVALPDLRGPDLAATLCATRPETRVLYTSGYAEDAALIGVAGRAEARFLGKPYTAASLGAAVRNAIDDHTS